MIMPADTVTYFINTAAAEDRRKSMQSSFIREPLVRVRAIDGMEWATDEDDADGRPVWKEDVFSTLESLGVFPHRVLNHYPWIPGEAACSLSHIGVWRRFLSTESEWAIVLEDDTEPTDRLADTTIRETLMLPDNVDTVFLFGPGHPGDRIRLNIDGTVAFQRSNMGYALSRKAAALAIKSMTPMYYQSDWQWGFRCFRGMEAFSQRRLPMLPELERYNAIGLFDPLIRHSTLAAKTTFTRDGKKSWLPPNKGIV